MMRLNDWLANEFPDYHHYLLGGGGATLLSDLIKTIGRPYFILPAFICPELSLMAVSAGKHVIHIDIEAGAPLMDRAALYAVLDTINPAEAVALVDHAFGLPCTWLPELRARYPTLFIIEDCVRALASVAAGAKVGHVGDAVLLSMYKSFNQNDHGAILLSRTPLREQPGPQWQTSWQKRLFNVPLLKEGFRLLKRFRHRYPSDPQRKDRPLVWLPHPGQPAADCIARFERYLDRLPAQELRNRGIRQALTTALAEIDWIRPIRLQAGSVESGDFLTVLLAPSVPRVALLQSLQRIGLFPFTTWDLTPFHFTGLGQCFASEPLNSMQMSRQIMHFPLAALASSRQVARLLAALHRFEGR